MTPDAERIERDALADLHRAASPSLVRSLGLRASASGETFQSVAAALPASAIVINRTLGLGLGVPAEEADVAQMVAAYRDAGVGRFFVQLHPRAMPNDLPDWLEAHGVRKARGWQKFSRGVQPPPDARTDLHVRVVDARMGHAFADIACDAFDIGDAAKPWLAELPGRKRWHIVMSFDGDQPAGVGALYVDGDTGWLDFGATAPRFRRRGSQSALMARRIALAAELGCRQLFTCTGEAVPGDPQHSFNNIERAGFERSYVRANYAPVR